MRHADGALTYSRYGTETAGMTRCAPVRPRRHRLGVLGALALATDVVANGRVADIPVALQAGRPQFDSATVGQGQVQQAAQVLPAELGQCALHLAAELARRIGTHDVECAADRIFAEQRTLWPAKHFDVIDVEQADIERERAAQRKLRAGSVRNLIDIDSDRGADIGAGSHAAKRDLGLSGALRVQAQARDGVRKIAKLNHPVLRELIRLEDGHRLRHLDQALRALLGGHNYLFRHAPGLGSIGVSGRLSWCRLLSLARAAWRLC